MKWFHNGICNLRPLIKETFELSTNQSSGWLYVKKTDKMSYFYSFSEFGARAWFWVELYWPLISFTTAIRLFRLSPSLQLSQIKRPQQTIYHSWDRSKGGRLMSYDSNPAERLLIKNQWSDWEQLVHKIYDIPFNYRCLVLTLKGVKRQAPSCQLSRSKIQPSPPQLLNEFH